ncbi:MAG: response regulator transcription factor [Kiritimatiellia bacterium]|nr:response regulator transcription factor [Kiritimatiellia bacterium]MDD4173802.1 response regulator transcription factor [Kiritimatiellia bacterium]MDD4441176.1 response regulator transcription factor [Kiritimatiellia bacterium]NLC81800.1 response regulator transcription factor [Lentisphaerota bacterium]
MANESVLIVEDDADIRELLGYTLKREGYTVEACDSAENAQNVLRRRTLPDLILLDLMLPGTDGYAFCRALRADERTARIPVIMVTARDEDADIVAGLEVGADDYVTKPFSARILVARIKAVLRRSAVEPGDEKDTLTQGPFEIDRLHHTARADGQALTLTLSEFKALELFAKRPGVVFSRYQIVDAIHGEDYPVTDRSVDVLIVGLRRKLGDCGEWIETVRGVGYRMKAE